MGYVTAIAQNGTGISVTGSTSVCPNALYSYQLQIVGTDICYVDVTSTGGHREICNTSHDFSSGGHATSDFGYFQSPTSPSPYPQGTTFTFCIHWVSSSTKNLCFNAYDCNTNLVSSFCLNIDTYSPYLTVQGNMNVCNGQYAYFTATSGLSNYAWGVVPDANEYIYPAGNSTVNIGNLQNSSWHMVSVSAVDCWGTTNYASRSFYTVQCLRNPGAQAEARDGTTNELPETGIVVYPNPVEKGERLMVNTETASTAIKEYRLYGLDGRLLEFNTVTDASTSLQMPNLPGVYILVLLDETNQLYRYKVTII